jgi:hypothetical protein
MCKICLQRFWALQKFGPGLIVSDGSVIIVSTSPAFAGVVHIEFDGQVSYAQHDTAVRGETLNAAAFSILILF